MLTVALAERAGIDEIHKSISDITFADIEKPVSANWRYLSKLMFSE